jgi:hypothetical protein
MNTDRIETIEQLYARYEATDCAYPSGRLLPEPLDGEEWGEHGTIDGKRVTVVYYFDVDDCAEEEENYPWDDEHVAYIMDAEGVPVIGRGWAGFPA